MEPRSVTLQVFFTGRAPTLLARAMVFMVCFTLVFSGILIKPRVAAAQEDTGQFASLKEVPRPVPTAVVRAAVDQNNPNAGTTFPDVNEVLDFQDLINAGIVKDQDALILLGKALFWDMQVGSDGVMACATCHFNGGEDIRSKNSLSPGLLDQNFLNNPLTGGNGDTTFGNSTMPFTANDPNTPDPPGPTQDLVALAAVNTPGFPQFTPNYLLTKDDFPFNDWFPSTFILPRGFDVDFADEFFTGTLDTNDVVSSQGVRRTQFVAIQSGKAVDKGTPLADIFNTATPGQLNTKNVTRRVEPRNAGSTINGVFHFDTFWDGRASFIFNGVNPFGFRDRTSTLNLNVGGTLTKVFVRVTNSGLPSQSVGPPLSDFEMSFAGRSFPELGKKMVSLKPLAKQLVHPQDSVLGPLAAATVDPNTGKLKGKKGLIPAVGTYADMIKAAFQDEWWNSDATLATVPGTAAVQKASATDPRTAVVSPGQTKVVKAPRLKFLAALPAGQYDQMMMNFSFFWGLAVAAYEATLISDDTPFDRFMGAPSLGIEPDFFALSDQQQLGLSIFMNEGKCNNCHTAPMTSNATILEIGVDDQGVPLNIVENMTMGDGGVANYDRGFYNIGDRRTTEDLARFGTAPNAAPFINPDTGDPFPLAYVALNELLQNNLLALSPDVARFVMNVPVLDRLTTKGAKKVPQLRNIEFRGPYMTSGQQATLRHVVEFYTRGGNFPDTNFEDLAPDMTGIPELVNPFLEPNSDTGIDALVAFLAGGLTDDRVKFKRAPFDHPQLFVPNGANDKTPTKDIMLEIPAVGASGQATSIPRFLDLDPNWSNPF